MHRSILATQWLLTRRLWLLDKNNKGKSGFLSGGIGEEVSGDSPRPPEDSVAQWLVFSKPGSAAAH